MSWFEHMYTLKSRVALIKTQLWYKRYFYKMGKHSRIIQPLRIANPAHMYFGNNVYIDSLSYIVVDTSFDDNALLMIQDNVKIGNMNHIACVDSVIIESNVLTADKVYISDNYHVFDNANMPIIEQGVSSKGKTSIGEGSWIGDNVAIISCRIGRHCVIGANSVVTHDVPDYCIAVGAPARIIKRYDIDTQKWVDATI